LKIVVAILTACVLSSAAHAAPAQRADGYRGIWYSNQPTGDEYRYKYSGGFATYPQQHAPIAVYSAAANKTFFCYGGATGKPKELASMVSYFDHATGQVPRPRVVLVKKTDDAHENPTLQIDDAGHLWIFCNSHGPANNSYIFRSVKPHSIAEFEQLARTNFSYSQPWFLPGEGFLFLHTRYASGRRLLHWMTSANKPPLPLGEGRGERSYPLPEGEGLSRWSTPALLAAVENGHYQISTRRGNLVATAFNYHPTKGGLNARTNLYYLETSDMGNIWRTASGESVATPITEKLNAALVFDYESMAWEGEAPAEPRARNGSAGVSPSQTRHKLVYLKDINFDSAGRPVILYLTSGGYAPGPANDPREWWSAHWTSDSWQRRRFTTSDHNYDFGSLYIERDQWRIIAPTDPGPQPYGAGGEMVMWTSRDEGRNWTKLRQLTRDSKLNHGYARRPVNAHPQFYALWADGNPLERSESHLYFTDREGSGVWRLPAHMDKELSQPETVTN
jgi:hypothetical protein